MTRYHGSNQINRRGRETFSSSKKSGNSRQRRQSNVPDADKTVEQWGDVRLASLRLKCNHYDLVETGRIHALQERLYDHPLKTRSSLITLTFILCIFVNLPRLFFSYVPDGITCLPILNLLVIGPHQSENCQHSIGHRYVNNDLFHLNLNHFIQVPPLL